MRALYRNVLDETGIVLTASSEVTNYEVEIVVSNIGHG